MLCQIPRLPLVNISGFLPSLTQPQNLWTIKIFWTVQLSFSCTMRTPNLLQNAQECFVVSSIWLYLTLSISILSPPSLTVSQAGPVSSATQVPGNFRPRTCLGWHRKPWVWLYFQQFQHHLPTSPLPTTIITVQSQLLWTSLHGAVEAHALLPVFRAQAFHGLGSVGDDVAGDVLRLKMHRSNYIPNCFSVDV